MELPGARLSWCRRAWVVYLRENPCGPATTSSGRGLRVNLNWKPQLSVSYWHDKLLSLAEIPIAMPKISLTTFCWLFRQQLGSGQEMTLIRHPFFVRSWFIDSQLWDHRIRYQVLLCVVSESPTKHHQNLRASQSEPLHCVGPLVLHAFTSDGSGSLSFLFSHCCSFLFVSVCLTHSLCWVSDLNDELGGRRWRFRTGKEDEELDECWF